ncbi:heme o synthase [Carnimonas bestiolae]|uniref:heme o synthase n=1 Tax=Carnimonas bestiolae TaxID=3402172 RepID=UPI003EDC3581
MLKKYLLVTKPGIIFGNLISVAGGFFLASRGRIDGTLLLVTLLGVALVIASGCVFNNVIDRDIDRLMERTRQRALVKGLISPPVALVYASVLGLAGFSLLYFGANFLAAFFGVIGFVVYVGFYSLFLKRQSIHGTLVGSISGAVPPVIGYCAVTGVFDLGALLLLLIFSMWQMPHSFAIGIFRYQDYKAAGVPVLPVARDLSSAKRQIIVYIIIFAVVALLLSAAGYAGYGYFAVTLGMSLYWLYLALKGFGATDDVRWARGVFGFSILIVTALSVMMALDFQTDSVLASQSSPVASVSNPIL